MEICAICRQSYPSGTAHTCTEDSEAQSELVTAPPAGSRGRSSIDPGLIIDGKYEVLEKLSEGGMGAVFKARHVSLSSLAAVKIVRSDGDPRFEQRFMQEARLASSVKHPNVVYISDFGSLPNGRSYLVMEYLEGRTLTSILKDGLLELPRALRLALQLVRGVAAAHDKSIIHRDLKPDNILILSHSGEELVKIIDFGIAKQAKQAVQSVVRDAELKSQTPSSGGGPSLTQAGAMIGTPGYMAPEQIRSGQIDRRTDQYAIGCILYKMLTGAAPFISDTVADIMAQHLLEPPPSLRAQLPQSNISPGLEALVARLLAKRPEERFASLQEVVAALLSELAAIEGTAVPPPVSGAMPVVQSRAIDASPELPTAARATFVLPEPTPVQTPTPAGAKATTRRHVALALIGLVALSGLLVGVGLWRRPPPEKLGAPSLEALVRLRDRAIAVLADDVRQSDAALRLGAIEAFGQSREPLGAPILIAILQASGVEREQAAVLEALGEIGDRQTVPLLLETFRRASTAVTQRAAAAALMAVGETAGVRFFEQALAGHDAETQLHAALLLCERGHSGAINSLEGILTHGDIADGILLAALSCQARSGSTKALAQLHDKLKRSSDEASRLAVAAKLAQLGQPAGVSHLRQAAETPGPRQLLAARLLATPLSPEAAALFSKVLADPRSEPGPRLLAVEGLAECGPSEELRGLAPLLEIAEPRLLRQASAAATLRIIGRDQRVISAREVAWAKMAMGDASWLIRHSAVPLLARNEEAEALSLLRKALRDGQTPVRLRVVRVLAHSTRPEALRGLEEALSNDRAEVREAALRAVVELSRAAFATGGNQVLTVRKWLQRLLADGNEEQRAVASAALLQLGDSKQSAEVRKLKSASSRMLRSLVAIAGPDDRKTLTELLADAEPSVRYAAAQRLAGFGERQGVEILKDCLQRGGAPALGCYAALSSLKEPAAVPQSLAHLELVESVEERMAVVEAAGTLPSAEAMLFLTVAARDPEPFVRRLAAEIVAELPDGPKSDSRVAVLALLSRDSVALVRARASVLLARVLLENSSSARALQDGYDPLLDRRLQSEGSAATSEPVAAGGSGTLSVVSPRPVFFQIDRSPWQRTPMRPMQLRAGAHRIVYLSGQQTAQVPAGGNVLVELSESQAEQLARTGAEARTRKDYRGAQRLLQKSVAVCASARAQELPCRALTTEVAYRLGQVFEAQERWADAMTEYQHAVKQETEVKGRVDYRSEAQAAITRLSPRVGQVIVSHLAQGRCSETMLWMTPGKHEIDVRGSRVSVVVRPRSVVRAGACSAGK